MRSSSDSRHLAQSERGTISGIVSDSSKTRLPGVTLQTRNTATNQATTLVSSESGAYSVLRLVAGAPRSEDILKCQLKPITLSDYKVGFTPAELALLPARGPGKLRESADGDVR